MLPPISDPTPMSDAPAEMMQPSPPIEKKNLSCFCWQLYCENRLTFVLSSKSVFPNEEFNTFQKLI